MTKENEQRTQIRITTYAGEPPLEIIELISHIQRNEFGIPITPDDQPDLKQIPAVYQTGNGNFWLAKQGDQIVGTIGLIDAGKGLGALRKMFVQKEFRGKELGIAHSLLQVLLEWSAAKGFHEIYLGTVPILQGALRFYDKHGFERVEMDQLPAHFPRMPVDTVFYRYLLVK